MKFHRIFLPFHIQNRSVQLVARNRERPKGINITFRTWFDRGSRCTLRTTSWITHIEVNHSCNKLHATHKIVNYTSRLIIRATRCTLRTTSWITHWGLICATSFTLRTKSWITHQGLLFVQQVARYAQNREWRIEIYHSCNKLHATHDIVNYTSKLIIRVLAGYNNKVRWNFTALFLLFHT